VAPSGAFRPDLITESRLPGGPRSLGRLSAAICLAILSSVDPAPAQFTSAVNAVEVYVTVTDEKGGVVTGLTREDFTVRENGDLQQISTFSAGEFPLSVAVALDRSFSMAGPRLAGARSAARAFLGELRPADESMVLAIGSTTEILAPLSRDRAVQLSALSELDAFGTTGLHDAIIAALDAIQRARGRRALVLLSDGGDRYSTATAADALARARASDVLVYPIAFGSARPPLFAEIAALTGGRSSRIEDPTRLRDALRSIAVELRHQYLLGYSPSKPIVGGSHEWRSIGVTVRQPRVRVRARGGYVG
jgi:Ca-activated chloride channel homolog